MTALLSYSYRVPYCVPYWNARTYRALLRCLCFGHIVDGPDIGQLARRLAQFFTVPDLILCGKGRVAIELALRVLAVSPEDEVVIPTFCCASVIPPILAVGAVPVLADVGEELTLTSETVEPVLSARTRAVIVPHLFGTAANIQGIIELCRPRHIAVIDDAAQAVGATLAQQPLGTFGDAGLMSFGNGKVCFGTGGGVFVAKDPDILERAKQIPLAPNAIPDALQNVFSVALWRTWRRWSLPLKVVVTRIRKGERHTPSYCRTAMSNIDAAVAFTLIETLEENLQARRDRVALYETCLGHVPKVRLLRHHPGSACLTQVIILGSPDEEPSSAQHLMKHLRAEGYEVNASYTPLHLQRPYTSYARGKYPNVEQVWDRIIELPCEPSVSLTDVEKISACIQAAL